MFLSMLRSALPGLLLLAGLSAVATTQPEDSQRISSPQASAMFWDNIEASFDGLRPRYRIWRGDDVLQLEPGARSLIELPAGHWLRVHHLAGIAHALVVSAGDGGGLFAAQPMQELSDDLYLLAPAASYRLLLLENQSVEPIALDLHRGHTATPRQPALVQTMASSLGAGVLLQPDLDRRHYALAGPGQPLRLDRLAGRSVTLELRPLDGQISIEAGTVLLRNERQQQRRLVTPTLPLARHPLLATTRDGQQCWRVAGAPQRTRLTIPSNEQILWLEPAQLSAVRVQSGDLWLWPASNVDRRGAEWANTTESRYNRLVELEASYRRYLLESLNADQRQPEARALRRVVASLDPVADRSVIDSFARSHTFWRALPGSLRGGPGEPAGQYAQAKARRLAWPAAQRGAAPITLNPAQAAAELEAAPVLNWLLLPAGGSATFELPPRVLASQLQLWSSTSPEAVDIAVSYDDELPHWLHYRPLGNAIDSRLDSAAVALQLTDPARTLAVLGSVPVRDSVMATLPLASEAKRVTVQLPNETEARWIAVRYRAPRVLWFDQAAALDYFDQADRVWQSLQAALQNRSVQTDSLAVYWPPLERLLRARRDGFSSAVDSQRLNASVVDWQPLLAELDAAGDRALAERLRRGLALQTSIDADAPLNARLSGQPSTQQAVFAQLLEKYQAHSSVIALQGLLASQIGQGADRSQLLPLAASLHQQGDQQLALAIALAAASGPQRTGMLHSIATALNYSQLLELTATRAGLKEPVLADIWQDPVAAQVSAAGQQLLYTPARELYFRMWRVDPQRPLKLPLKGPGQYRITLRPLHDDPSSSVDDQVSFELGSNQFQLKITGNRVHNSLTLIGDSRRAGDARRELLEIEGGAGQLVVRPSNGSLLVDIERLGSSPEPVHAQLDWRQTNPLAVRLVDDCQWRSVVGTPRYPRWPQASSQVSSASLNGLTATLQNSSQAIASADSNAAFSRLLSDWRERPSARPMLWQQALELATQDQSLVSRLASLGRGRWQQVDQVLSSDGLVSETVSGWQTESPRMRLRQRLLDIPADYWLLPEQRSQKLELDLLEAADLAIDLHLQLLPFALPGPVTIELEVNGNRESVVLDADRPQRKQLRLAAGNNMIALRRLTGDVDVDVDGYALVRISQRRAGGGWQKLQREFQRTYYVSSQRRPLRINLDQAAWLRINSWDGQQGHDSRYQLATSSGALTLEPASGREQSWLRVFRYQPNFDDVVSEQEPSTASTTAVTLPGDQLQLEPLPADQVSMRAALDETALPHGDEDATWSLGLRWQRRQELDAADDEALEEFTQLAWNYRQHLPAWHSYYQAEVLARRHQRGDHLIGMRHWLEWVPPHSPWSFSAQASVFQQQIASTGLDARSYLLRVDAQRQIEWSDRIRHRTRLAIFARRFNDNAKRIDDFAEVDQDIASRFKLAHQHGWTLSDRWSWRHRLDSEFYAEAQLRGNEFGDELLDQVNLGGGWRTFANGVAVDVGLRSRWFLADNNRRSSRASQRLSVNADWLDFPTAQWGWRARVGLVHDFDRADTSFQLGLVWIADDRRGVKDFRPRSLSFRELHDRRQQSRPIDQSLIAKPTSDG